MITGFLVFVYIFSTVLFAYFVAIFCCQYDDIEVSNCERCFGCFPFVKNYFNKQKKIVKF